jgi:hypothetical protein
LITSFDFSGLSNLVDLQCSNNSITTLNLAPLTSLLALNCEDNYSLTSLDVSNNTAMTHLTCRNGVLSNLNTTNLNNLFAIWCENNQLTSMNLCSNSSLKYIFCQNNLLSTLDLRGTPLTGIYIGFSKLITTGNSNNLKVYVYNPVAATANGNFLEDSTTSYTNAAAVGGTVSSNQTVCMNSQPTALSLTGYTGSILKWQKSNTSDFSASVTDIYNGTATLSSEEMGSIDATTYFRALVGGTCFPSVSNTVTIERASSTTWNGSSWSNGTPTSTKEVIISAPLTISSDWSACSLKVNNGAVVSVSSGYNLTVSRIVDVELGSSLTFANNSNLLQNTNVTNSGNVIVNRDTNPLMRLDYTLWSSPVFGQQLQAFSPQTLSNRFYTYNPDTNFYNAVAAPDNTNFDIGKGYLIRLPNSHPITPTIWQGQFQGVPNNGTYTLPVTTNTYNAIGNPYPSVIDADSFIVNNSISDALYFWRKTNNSAHSSYATYTLAGGASNEGGLSSLVPNGFIQVGQGFIVKAPSTTISFTNAMRVPNNNNQFFRNTEIERHRIWLNLTTETFAANQLLVSYMTSATNEVDPSIDGSYINDSPIALNSYLNNGEYIIQGRSLPFTDTDVVPLTFKTTIAGNYTIAIDHVDGLFSGNQNIYIRDVFTGIVHDLKQSAYSYATTTGIFNNRFELVYTNTPLSTQNPIFNENSIVVYKQNEVLHINSGNSEMKSVRIFDVRGRLIYEQKAIGSNALAIKDLTATNQVLIVQITAVDDQMLSKKVVY